MSRALALAMLILALLLVTPHMGTQAQGQVEVKIRWVTYIDSSALFDGAYGTCEFGDYIAVVGRAGFTKFPFVVLLRKSDGGVVKRWEGFLNSTGSGKIGEFYNCISIDGKLYAIGQTFVGSYPNLNYYGVIYVFDVNLNILARNMSESPITTYFSLAYDGRALYIGGIGYEDLNGDSKKEPVWLVEKRDPVSLSLIASRKIYFGSWKEGVLSGVLSDIGVEPSTGNIWAVGYYEILSDKFHSLIVVLDSSLRDLKVIDYPKDSEGYLGWLRGIAFDGKQYAYIVGSGGIAKFSLDGKLVAINRDEGARYKYKIVYGYNYLYTFAGLYIKGYYRHVLIIHDTNLNIVKRYVLSENVDANSYFGDFGRPALEGNNIYVAGYYSAPNRNVVYSLSIGRVTETSATSIFEPSVEFLRYVRDKVRLYSEQFDPNFYSEKSEEYRRIVYEKSRELLKVDTTSVVKSIAMGLASKYLPPLTYYSYAEKLLRSFEVVGYMLLDLMYQSLYHVFSALNYWSTAGSISGKLRELADMLDSVVKAVEDRDAARYEELKEQLKGKIEDTVRSLQLGETVLYQRFGWEPTGVLYSYYYRMPILKASRMIGDLLVTLDALYTLLYNDSLSKFYELDRGEGLYTPTDVPYVANFTWYVNGVKSYTARGGDSVKLVVDVDAKPFRKFQCSKIRVVVYKDIALWLDTPIKDAALDLEDRLYKSTSLSVEFNAEDSFLLRGYKFKAYAYGCSYPLPYKEGENRWIPLVIAPVIAPQMEFSPSGEGSQGFTRITTYPPGLMIESAKANSGVLVHLSESGHRLHIRLVDDLGRIVGYYQGSIRRDIDGSDYIVLENSVAAIAPLGNYKIVIDTSEMSEEKVTYNLTINIISNGEKIKEETRENMSIEKGEEHEYTITQPQTPTTTTTTTPEIETGLLPLAPTAVSIIIVAAISVILLLRRRRR